MTPAAPQRKRVSQACDRCRSRKDKCDGAKPICSTCAIGGHTCTYDPSIKKRGLPEGYVRGLEKIWGLTIREAPDVEATILTLIDTKDGIELLSRAWGDRDCEETLLDTWRKSRLYRELDTLLPLLEIADDKTAKRKRQDSSGTPIAAAPLLESISLNRRRGRSASLFTDPVLPNEPSANLHGSPNVIASDAPRRNTELVELPQNTWELLDIYFSYTHCWLPIVEKHNLLRASYLYPAMIEAATPGSGDHAALWAILAYTEAHHAAIERGTAAGRMTQQHEGWPAAKLYSFARGLIPDEDGTYELGHVQALLLLTLHNMGQNRWKQAWILVGQAVRIAIELGLGDEVDGGKVRNRHVFFACFILDTFVSTRQRRAPHIRAPYAMRHGLLQEDGLDEWNPWVDTLALRRRDKAGVGSRGPGAALSTFNHLVKLSVILNTIICDGTPDTERLTKGRTLLLEFTAQSKKLQNKPRGQTLPQQHLVEVLYACLCSVLEMKQMESTTLEVSPVDPLNRLRIDYTLSAAPPLLECFVAVYIRQQEFNPRAMVSESTLSKLAQVLVEFGEAWPSFRDTQLELLKLLGSASESLISNTGFNPRNSSSGSHMMEKGSSFEGSRPRARSGVDETYGTPSSVSAYTDSGQAILEAAIQFDPSLLAANNDFLQNTPPPWPLSSANPDMATGSSAGPQSNLESPDQSLFRTFDAQIDDDSMFNEFATLDAMKWTNNWDQGLQNLGFTDPDKMNQDFYAFFKEPHPIYPRSDDLVQHFLANPTLPGSLMMPVSGGFSNPHVEAGQILQSLSTSEQPLTQKTDIG